MTDTLQSDRMMDLNDVAEVEVPLVDEPVLPDLPENDDGDDDVDDVDGDGLTSFLPEAEERVEMSEGNQVAEQPMVDATYRVRMPASQSPVNLGGLANRQTNVPGVGTAATHAACVEHLRALSEDVTSDGFRVVIRRRGPASFNGFRLPATIIEEMEAMPFEDIQARVADLHGGGTYNLQVITPAGQLSRQMLFRVDENVHEPKVPANAMPVNVMQSSDHGRMVRPGMNLGPGGFGTHTPADDEIAQMHKEEQIIQAKRAKEEREYELEKTRRKRKLEEEADREAEERKKMMPEIVEANRRVEDLRAEMRNMAESFKDVVRDLTTKKDDGGLKLVLEAMKISQDQQQAAAQRHAESMAQQNKQQMDLLIAMLTKEKPQDSSVLEAIKMSAETTKQTTQMIVESAKNENSVMRDLFTTVVTQRLTAPDDQVKLHRDAEDRGWSKAMEITRLLEEARSGGDDGIEVDPESGFLGNLSNIALQGISRAVRGASSGGLRGALQGLLSPQAGLPAQYPPQQYVPPALPPVHPMQQLPPAPPVHRLPPAPPVVQTEVFPSTNPEVESSPLFAGVIHEEAASASVSSVSSAPSLALPVPSPVLQQVDMQEQAPEEEDLRLHVTEAMRMALDDFRVGRKVHDWSDHAIDKWHRQFKVQLAQAPDDAARIQLIGAKCEPAVFEQILSRVRGGGQDVMNFVQAIQMVVQDTSQEFAA